MESLLGSNTLCDLKRSNSIAGHLDDEWEKLCGAGKKNDDFGQADGHLDDEWEKLCGAGKKNDDFGQADRLLLSNGGMTDPPEKRNENVLPNESNKHLAGENTDRLLIPYNDGIVTDSCKSEKENISNGSPQTRAISISESPRNENVITHESDKHLVAEYSDAKITNPRKRERKNIINGSPQTRVISIRGSPKRDLMARENKNMEIIRVLSQPERDQPGCSSTKHFVENQIRSNKVVNINNVGTRDQRGERNDAVWNDKEYFYERRALRDFKVVSEHEFIEKTRCVHNYPKKSRKLDDELNIAKRDHMAMVKVRRQKIELTDDVGQSKKDDADSKRSLKNVNQKDVKGNNEDNRREMIFNKNDYFYEKCSRVIREDWRANVNRVQPVKGKRLVREDYEYERNGSVNVNLAQSVKDYEYEQNGFVQTGNKRFKENHGEHVDQFQSNKRKVLQSGKKFKKIIEQVNEANERPDIVLDSEDSYEEPGPVKRNSFERVDEYPMESRTELKKIVKEENMIGTGGKGNCSKLHEKTENIEEKNSDDDASTEVEILDSAEIIKQGNLSSFVPSAIYRSDFGVSKVSSDYRERVLNVLKKPFDKEEYRRLTEEVQFYLGKYPDLKKKLKKYRYKRLTRTTILRGFFYWLQNVMHNEAFKPWEDPQCLAVQPGSG